MSHPYRIAIAGLGTVGAGVVALLQENRDLIASRCGRGVEVVTVSARERNKDRGVDLSAFEWSDIPGSIANRNDIDAVIELIGGAEGEARKLVTSALKVGKAVVSANKALIAEHGKELAELSERYQAPLMYEGAVAGGIPAIKALREGFAANRINAVYGILNGTCNYILTTMQETGQSFKDVLSEAQAKGYAEADPSFDIDGIDTAHKLCILSSLAFGVNPVLKALKVDGITHISADDIRFAHELGYRIKLLGVTRRENDRIVQLVEPCLIPEGKPMAAVDNVFNAVMIDGDFVDTGLLVGRGAGAGPTASAVVADIMDLARGHHLPVFGMPAANLLDADWLDSGEMRGQFYLRLTVIDRPGVLADITAIMRDYNISMGAVLQRGHDPDKPVAVVITTHMVKRSDIQTATDKMAALEACVEKPCLLRIEHFPAVRR